VKFLVVQDTTVTPLANRADVVLAGATFAEKAGCYVNADGRLQYAAAALPPREGALPDLDLLAILLHRPGGPVHSGEVLAELAQTVPAFAVAQGGKLPPFGAIIGQAPPRDGPPAPPSFADTWSLPQGTARWR
jgi:predicted molibdopterin-dependent oxidoreductase YjgC